jgi:hypothetical protein
LSTKIFNFVKIFGKGVNDIIDEPFPKLRLVLGMALIYMPANGKTGG